MMVSIPLSFQRHELNHAFPLRITPYKLAMHTNVFKCRPQTIRLCIYARLPCIWRSGTNLSETVFHYQLPAFKRHWKGAL